MNPSFQRLGLLIGAEALNALARTKVSVFGIGGVGSWAAEALVRSGVSHIDIIDSDTICITNTNRQVQALPATVGQAKVAVLKERLLAINPHCSVQAFEKVFARESADSFALETSDYVIDAIDSLTYKLDLIESVCKQGVPLFSSMGTAQKLDPCKLRSASIWETDGCPLARLVRQGLRKRGFHGDFIAVYSPERLPLHTEIPVSCGGAACLCPCKETASPEWCASKKVINGSAVTVTASAGFILAGLVLQDVYARYNY